MSWEFISNLLLASVRMATPLIFLALAELYSQRAGLVHIGLEGLASIGSLVGFLVSLITGNPLLGVLAGAAAGILVNMIYAYATITLCAEQIVYGMAINIFAPALASFIYRVYFGAGSELVQVSLMETLASRMGITANGFIAKLFLDQTPMVYLAYLLVVFTVIYFNRTKSGLNYKAVGEYPKAAATLGIDVIGIKYTASVICGALAGIGGAYLTTCYTTTYVDGNIAGRGFIALAAVIFGRWNAGGVLIACLFFGFCDALQIRLQVGSYNIPYQFFQMIPYIATVVVLAAIGMKKAGPKSCGKPYRKEEL
ncbi:MAG: ABC transporter permease [Eubacteriales bacterium]|nr:ABC transporter permease [Clostridiales bacterium]MDY4469640.1 ABC transporter permease [Eubacteriales bacterium]MCI6961325.1 ABC transporter permease [Clostridiales bacterium]MDD5809099.1 ABC transporter permease [Clostridiales bacterium]MDD5908674.1 ABC transporter permease [Clostridiales bacterium]